MFPPLLCLVLLFGLVPCFPLGVFPLPLLTLKKRLYLREQDTGKGLYLVIGNPCAVVIGLLSARVALPCSATRISCCPSGQETSFPTFCARRLRDVTGRARAFRSSRR